MVGDNGEVKKEEVSTEPKRVLEVFLLPNGAVEMKTTLVPPMVIWMLEQIKFQLISNNQEKESKIIQPQRGGIMNFVRGGMKK